MSQNVAPTAEKMDVKLETDCLPGGDDNAIDALPSSMRMDGGTQAWLAVFGSWLLFFNTW